MPARSKRPKVDINDAVDVVQLVASVGAQATILRGDIGILLNRAAQLEGAYQQAQAAINALVEKLQAATPPAPKARYRKEETAILEKVPARKGGWKRKGPTRAKARKSTLPKRLSRRPTHVKGLN